MSDQNQWPKPGESNGSPDGQQRDGQQPDARQPDARHQDGRQPGAYQPPMSAPSSSAQDPWSRSGQGTAAQGVTGGSTAPQGQQGPSSYGQQPQPGQQAPYGQAPQGQQTPYGQQPTGASYGQAGANPYAQPPGNPYAQPQGTPYAQQQGGNPYAAPYATGGYQPYAQRPRTNTLAILSIVFAYAGIIIWPLVILSSPAGAIMGHIALGKIKQSGEAGRGLALAGIIGGWVLTGLYVLFAVVFIIAIASSHGYSDSYDYDSGAFIG